MWCRSVAAAQEVEDNARAPGLSKVRCACSAELDAVRQLCNQCHGLHASHLTETSLLTRGGMPLTFQVIQTMLGRGLLRLHLVQLHAMLEVLHDSRSPGSKGLRRACLKRHHSAQPPCHHCCSLACAAPLPCAPPVSLQKT